MVFFQFSNILEGLGPGPGQGQAQARSKPGPRPFRILENWKNTIKIENYWKLLEIIGKLKVFQYFCSKILENQWFSIIFHLTGPMTGPGQAQAKPKTLQNIGKLEKHHKNWKLLEIIGKLKVFQYC